MTQSRTSISHELPRLGSPSKRVWTWVSMGFSCAFFIPLIVAPQTSSNLVWATSILTYCVFLFLYWSLVTRAYSSWLLLAVSASAFAGFWVNPGSLILAIYPAFAAHYYRGKWFGSLVAVCLMGLSLLLVYLLPNQSPMMLLPTIAGVLLCSVFGFLERRATLQQMQQYRSEEAIEALSAMAERERIGRDLHDSVGHELSAIALMAEVAQKAMAAGRDDLAREQLAELAQRARSTLGEVRAAVSGLKLRGLVAQWQKMTQLLQQQGISVEYSGKPLNELVSTLTIEQEATLIAVLQELTTNVLRHSNAKRVTLTLAIKSQQIELVYADDGDSRSLEFGNGLTGIQERIDALNGTSDITSDNGVTVHFRFPLDGKRT